MKSTQSEASALGASITKTDSGEFVLALGREIHLICEPDARSLYADLKLCFAAPSNAGRPRKAIEDLTPKGAASRRHRAAAEGKQMLTFTACFYRKADGASEVGSLQIETRQILAKSKFAAMRVAKLMAREMGWGFLEIDQLPG